MQLLYSSLVLAGLLILPAFGEDVADKTKNAAKKAGDKTEDVAQPPPKKRKRAPRRQQMRLRKPPTRLRTALRLLGRKRRRAQRKQPTRLRT